MYITSLLHPLPLTRLILSNLQQTTSSIGSHTRLEQIIRSRILIIYIFKHDLFLQDIHYIVYTYK